VLLALGALLSACTALTGGTAEEVSRPPVDSGSPPDDEPSLGSDGGADETGDGDGALDGCDLTGTYAMEADIDVTWKGTSVLVVPILNMGAGKLRITTRLTIERAGDQYSGRIRACSTETPDFASDTVGERYAVRFPEALWDAADMPEWELPITVACNEPGCALKSDTLHALLGVDLDNPAAKWPETWRDPQLLYKDHDGDGYPGLTVTALNAPPLYTYPPVVIFPVTVRATSLMLAIRVTTLFDGAITSCDRFDGNGPASAVETRAASCIQDDGNLCGTTDTPLSTSAATFLDENLPKWEVEKATWTVVRLADDASCDDVRQATF
jgi:hypothetical protein